MKTLTLIAMALSTAALSTGVLATAPLAAQAPATAPAQPAAQGNADAGKKLYTSVGCYQCHGYEGQGGAAGPRLAPKPMALAAFLRFVRTPPNQMPGYGPKILTDAQLTDIHAYLAARPAPVPVAKLPLRQ